MIAGKLKVDGATELVPSLLERKMRVQAGVELVVQVTASAVVVAELDNRRAPAEAESWPEIAPGAELLLSTETGDRLLVVDKVTASEIRGKEPRGNTPGVLFRDGDGTGRHTYRPGTGAVLAVNRFTVPGRRLAGRPWRMWRNGAPRVARSAAEREQVERELRAGRVVGRPLIVSRMRGKWAGAFRWDTDTGRLELDVSRDVAAYARIRVSYDSAKPQERAWSWRVEPRGEPRWFQRTEGEGTAPTLERACKDAVSGCLELTVKPSCSTRDTTRPPPRSAS